MSVENEAKCHDDSELKMFQSQEDVPGFPETIRLFAIIEAKR